MKKVLILFSVTLILVFASTACEAGKKGTSIEGKVVDGSGKPLAGIKVVATQREPLKGYEKFETKTKGDGSFVLKGLYPQSAYDLLPEGGQCNNAKKEIATGPAGETKMLKEHIALKFSPFKVSKDGIITDPRAGLEWAPVPNEDMNWDQASQYAQSLSLNGGGWRLPTIAELSQLNEGIALCRGFFAEPKLHPFNATNDNWAWSSESCYDSPYARYFGFNTGADCTLRDHSKNARVFAVRSRR